MPLTVERAVTRPSGGSISFSQINHDCDLALYWHRQRIPRSGLGIYVIYGSAVHRGIEAFSKRQARTHKEAVRSAVALLDREINAPNRNKMPLQWDEQPETNKDGSISKSKGNYGRLWCREAAVYWLERQVPAWLKVYGDVQILRAEHQVFVPLAPAPHWKKDYVFEARLDLECVGDLVIDIKTTAEPWDDFRKYEMQARLYQAAYYVHYGRIPRFAFHVLPRTYGPDRIQEWDVPFDAEKSQNLINGVVRRKVEQIESGIFPAKPSSRSCNSRFCNWHHHCIFGTGTNLT